MTWLPPSIIASLVGTVTLTTVYYFLYTRYKEKFMLLWALSWGCYSLRYITLLLFLFVEKHPLLLILNQSFTILNGLLLFAGASCFSGKKVNRLLYAVGALGIFWVAFGILSEMSFLWQTIPIFGFLGFVNIWTGLLVMRSSLIESAPKKIVAYAFILWGLHKFNYPFLRHIEWFAPWGYLIAAALGLVISLGILLAYYEELSARLSSAKRWYESLFNDAAHGSAVAEADSGIIVSCNRKLADMLGYTIDEIVGKHQSILHPVNNDETFSPSFKEHRVSSSGKIIETQLVKKDGSMIDVEIQATHLERDGKAYLQGFFYDLSERKRVEEKNRYQQHLLEVSQQLGRIGTWELDITKNKLIWTDENCRIFGVPPGSIVDYEIFLSKVHPDDIEYVDEQWQAAMRGHPYDIEHRLLKDGEVSWVREKADVTFNEKEEAIYAIGFTQDITERKLAEYETQRLAENLKAKNAQLERFVYTVSHDLKSPLVTISNYSGMVKEELATEKRENCEKQIDVILKASKRMEQLLGALLNISRIGVKIRPNETVNLETLIKEAMENISGVISENNTIIDVEEGLPDVVVDRQYYLQVIENLITNASRYSREAENGSLVKIGIINNPEEKICYVKDNGLGIEAQYLEKVFDLFEKLDANSDSTGVGLAIVKRIIEAHGGRIWAESQGLGQGTTFFFTISEA